MRLIDADALKHVLCDECEYSKTLCVEKADCDTVYAIDAQPTIEAVPVEWIEAYMQSIGSRTLVGYRWIEMMLEEWREQSGAKMDEVQE